MAKCFGGMIVLTVAFALVACTSQPAMKAANVAALNSGELVITQPPGNIAVLSPRQADTFSKALAAGLAGAFAGGQMGMMAAESNALGDAHHRHERAVKILKPYAGLVNARQFSGDLQNVGRQAVAGVAWFKGGGHDVVLENQPDKAITGRMKQITRTSGVNAVAFMFPRIVLAPDLSSVYVAATIKVYANGARGKPIFLSSGDLLAGARLAGTSPALEDSGFEGIAASKDSDAGALGARANVWFANHGARIRQAVEKCDKILAVKLRNFLNGHRGTANPYKT